MFDSTSRYASIETRVHQTTGPGGEPREVRHLRRRFLPAEEGETLLEHSVTEGDRLDNVTARYLGDPLQFWRIADANAVLRPDELTDEPGRRIRVTLPRR
ncbi:MAG TPA: hypothetical protein VF665_19240 [Longimicrobium sp.]|jgi:hypothetical protein|uniref:hypothetical protein n=1 Tax=Longimicrobium sp. TaxID=2029185 RepID=UPI002EDB31A7